MSIGQILLIIVSILVALGVCQRVLDRLRLTDRQALAFAALIFIGSLIPDISLPGNIKINIGGAVVPIALCVYLFVKAGSRTERIRSVAATLASSAAVLAAGTFFPDEPETMFFDINYLYGILAGIIAYAAGRSRRAAFIAGVGGIVLADAFQTLALRLQGHEQTLRLGGAGIMDVVVISGLAAVLTSELIGEFLERLSRGARKDPHRRFENGRIIKEGRK